MTRLLTLLLLASALLAGAVAAQPAPLPPDERFDEPVSFSTTREGEDLATMVSALARSVGLTPVVDDVPDEIVRYDIDEPTPFRQVWNLLLSLNDLDYVLQENDVVVVGPPESLASLRRPDAPTEPGAEAVRDAQVQMVYRVNGNPENLSAIVSRLVPSADVDVLPGTSALVVMASESVHAEVRDTLDEFDDPAVEPRRYQVAGPGEEARDYLLTFVPEAEIEVAANALLVTATEDQHTRVQEALDAYQPPDVAEAPEEGPETERRVYRVNGVPSQVDEIVTTLVPEVVDTEPLDDAGVLVVIASEDRHVQVQEVLDEFDTPTERVDLEQRIFALNNAQADELQEVLNDTELVVEGETAEADGEDGDGEEDGGDDERRTFTVVADERTNSLIVTATPAVQARLSELIPELDAPQRQVNVQVRIQEINRRVASNLGINMGAATGNFAANLLDSGLKFVFDPQAAVSGLNIGAVLDTLETQGLSRTVDDATLTVLNNRTASMNSGGNLTIVPPEREEINIEYGVTIDVTPRVSEDGRITLDVDATVDDLIEATPELVDIGGRTVSSTITLRPGQTVLLGGLLQNSFSQTERRIPILGQIPLLGALFGSTEVQNENTELMLVVTAQVLD